jgi:hypothetical protein
LSLEGPLADGNRHEFAGLITHESFFLA